MKVFVDSDCDITKEEAASYGYSFIPMPYFINGKEIIPYEDFKNFDHHAYYDLLRKGTIPTTSGLSPLRYKELFEPAFQSEKEILYIHFSQAMSGTFDAMRLAINDLRAKYPNVRFEEIDTKSITFGAYAMILEMTKLIKKGASMDDLLDYAKKETQHYACYFFADNLKFFAKSGRVSGLKAAFGNLFGIKPLIFINEEGKMLPCGKAKGRNGAIQALIDRVEELGDDIKNHPFILGHTDAPEIAAEIETILKKKYGDDLKITRAVTNPTCGAHSGPDGVGIAFHSKKR